MYWRRMFWDNDFRIFQYVSSDIIHSVWYPSAQPCTITDPSRHRNLRGSSDSNVATPQNFLSARVFRDEVVFLVWLVFGHTNKLLLPTTEPCVCMCVLRCRVKENQHSAQSRYWTCILDYSCVFLKSRVHQGRRRKSSEGLTGFDWVRLISLTKRNAISLQRNEAMAYAAWRYLNKDQRRGMLLIVGCDHVTCRLVNLVWIPQGNWVGVINTGLLQ